MSIVTVIVINEKICQPEQCFVIVTFRAAAMNTVISVMTLMATMIAKTVRAGNRKTENR